MQRRARPTCPTFAVPLQKHEPSLGIVCDTWIPLLRQHKRLFGEVASFDAFPRVPDSSQFSSVQSVSWFGEASRGEPGYPDFRGTLKVKKDDDWTCPLPPIKQTLHTSDAADCEVAKLTPLIGWFSAPAGTFEFGHFQETHDSPRFLHPPVAHVERVELAGQQVVARGGGAMSC